jgi:aspartate racemase
MKTIGLIGGTGWVSTQEYYKIINEKVNEKLGGMQFPGIILYPVN